MMMMMVIMMTILVMMVMITSEEGVHKVADVPTNVAQDAILDHMGSDFRCQTRAMTTKNC